MSATPSQESYYGSPACARWVRDRQWAFADQVASSNPLWWCWWNKNKHHKVERSDLYLSGLLDGMELRVWLETHPDWWQIGEWDEDHFAAPVRLTAAGKRALNNRHLYDLEPVQFGPSHNCYFTVPAEKSDA